MTISQVSQVKTTISGMQPLCFDYIILSVQEFLGLEKAFADHKVAPRLHKRSGLAEKCEKSGNFGDKIHCFHLPA